MDEQWIFILRQSHLVLAGLRLGSLDPSLPCHPWARLARLVTSGQPGPNRKPVNEQVVVELDEAVVHLASFTAHQIVIVAKQMVGGIGADVVVFVPAFIEDGQPAVLKRVVDDIGVRTVGSGVPQGSYGHGVGTGMERLWELWRVTGSHSITMGGSGHNTCCYPAN